MDENIKAGLALGGVAVLGLLGYLVYEIGHQHPIPSPSPSPSPSAPQVSVTSLTLQPIS